MIQMCFFVVKSMPAYGSTLTATAIGYQEVAHNFVYVQRTLAGLQTTTYQKESLISTIVQEDNAAYEDVVPYIERKMQSAVKNWLITSCTD